MNDAYKMFMKIQEQDKKRNIYKNYAREEIIDILIEMDEKIKEIEDLIQYYDTKMRMDDEIYIDDTFFKELKEILGIN